MTLGELLPLIGGIGGLGGVAAVAATIWQRKRMQGEGREVEVRAELQIVDTAEKLLDRLQERVDRLEEQQRELQEENRRLRESERQLLHRVRDLEVELAEEKLANQELRERLDRIRGSGHEPRD